MNEWPSIVEALSTLVAAVAAVVAVSYAIRQFQLGALARMDARAADLQASRERLRAERLHRESKQPYVVASPMPELSRGRDLVLLIKNYGPTAAHDLRVTFPGRRVVRTVARQDYSMGYGWRDALALATTTLAPGQGIIEPAALVSNGDARDEFVTTEISVNYRDALGEEHENRYSLTYSEAVRMPPSETAAAIDAVTQTLKKWSSGQAMRVEMHKSWLEHFREEIDRDQPVLSADEGGTDDDA